jgi:glutamate racemase
MLGQALMFNTRPIMIFDSGVGGLSVLDAIRETLPSAPIVYAADNAGYPYGTKSEAEIAARVPAMLGRLAERFHPQIIVIACNTASTIALPHVRGALDLAVVGTVPAVKPAALASVTRTIGILGTKATVRQPYVDTLIDEHAADCTVLRLGSADLVDMAEAKLRGAAPDQTQMRMIMNGLYGQTGGERIDQLVLACTHFPLLAAEIAAVSPAGVTLVDSGRGIARRTAHLTAGTNWAEGAQKGIAVFTQASDDLSALTPALVARGLIDVQIL